MHGIEKMGSCIAWTFVEAETKKATIIEKAF